MDINMAGRMGTNYMTNHSTVGLCSDRCLSAMLGYQVLALFNICFVDHCLVLGAALLLLVALLLSVGGTLLLRHVLNHGVALWHGVSGTLLLCLSHIVSHMFSVADSLRNSMALLAGHHLIGHLAPGLGIVAIASAMAIGIPIPTTMAIVPTIARVSISIRIGISLCICRGFCFC